MAVERHLVLVHTPGFQDVRDFDDIARKVHELAPDIEVFIASQRHPVLGDAHAAPAGCPTLVFSPGELLELPADARQDLCGKRHSESSSSSHASRLPGIPVPPSVEITPGVNLPEAAFGSHVVVKPGYSTASHGHDMTLMRREAVQFRAARVVSGRSSRPIRPDVRAAIHRHRRIRQSPSGADTVRHASAGLQNQRHGRACATESRRTTCWPRSWSRPGGATPPSHGN